MLHSIFVTLLSPKRWVGHFTNNLWGRVTSSLTHHQNCQVQIRFFTWSPFYWLQGEEKLHVLVIIQFVTRSLVIFFPNKTCRTMSTYCCTSFSHIYKAVLGYIVSRYQVVCFWYQCTRYMYMFCLMWFRWNIPMSIYTPRTSSHLSNERKPWLVGLYRGWKTTH